MLARTGAIAVGTLLLTTSALAAEPPPGTPQYCPFVSKTFTAPAVLVPDPKSISHLWRATYNCWRAPSYSNQQIMYFTAAPKSHSEAFPQNQMLFDWDDDGALLLVDVGGKTTCAVTVDYWSDDGKCLPMAK